MLSQLLPGLSIFGSMFLTCAIVHLDAIPGVKQDWLARPIPRGSLLREKFLFVIATVCGPMFVGNLFLGVANGFGFRSALFQATIFVVYLFFFTVLPIFALAAVTRNMTEAFVMGCACAFLIGASITVYEFANGASHNTVGGVVWSGVGWIGEAIRLGLAAIAATLIAGVQYFRRKNDFGASAAGWVRCSNIYLGGFPVARRVRHSTATFRERQFSEACAGRI